MADDFAIQRMQMIEKQLRLRGINDPLVLQAMQQVPREHFIKDQFKLFAYRDQALPIAEEQTISQPYIVALMAQALKLQPQMRVLEIGTGSGYAAAVLSRIVSSVYTVERHHGLALQAEQDFKDLGYSNIFVSHGDGSQGWPQHAPYDAISVTCGGPHIPNFLQQQLAIKGRLIMPVGKKTTELNLLCLTKISEEECVIESLGSVCFVPLIGKDGWES